MNQPFAISYTAIVHENGEFKVRSSVELYYADDLQSCFDHASKVLKELFPKCWPRDFMITNADGSEKYTTNDDVRERNFQLTDEV